MRFRMKIAGMTCTDCEVRVDSALRGAGATAVVVEHRRGEAMFDAPSDVDVPRLAAAVQEAGYRPGPTDRLAHPPARNTPGQGRTRPGARGLYDLAIVGSGGAAFSAAIHATEAGARVVMIERATVGGTCVNVGCVPSKTLLRAGEIHHLAGHHLFAGLGTAAGVVDMKELVAQKDGLVRELRTRKYDDLIADYGWELVRGEAQFTGPSALAAADRRIEARAFLVATGARPAVPNIAGLAEAGYLTSTTALELDRVPRSVAVIGSGYIALELGQLLRRLGARVTLMQRGSRLLPGYDPEVSETMKGVLDAEGIDVLLGVRYDRVEGGVGARRVHVEVRGREQIIEVEDILVAAGRQPNTESLRLDRAGVRTGERGQVLIDAELRTNVPSILAAGDVTLGPQFVYVAAYEGRVAAANALGAHQEMDLSVVPSVTFTSPAVATVGLTEERARAAGYAVKTSTLPLDAVPRALVNHDVRGVFKLVADAKTDRLLGAHVVAENAGDVIYAATLAVKYHLTVADLANTMAPYLTMAEGMRLASQTFDRDVDRLSCCAG